MRPQKRSWIYDGLAHPPSVVLVRPKMARQRLPPGSKLLVAGDEHAWGLSPFLKQLCADTQVDFHQHLADGNVESWAAKRLLRKPVAEIKPHMVVVSLTPSAAADEALDACLATISEDGRRGGATLVWLRSPDRTDVSKPFRLRLDAAKIPSFHSEALTIPRGADDQPSVRGYAGWAGALWRWIG